MKQNLNIELNRFAFQNKFVGAMRFYYFIREYSKNNAGYFLFGDWIALDMGISRSTAYEYLRKLKQWHLVERSHSAYKIVSQAKVVDELGLRFQKRFAKIDLKTIRKSRLVFESFVAEARKTLRIKQINFFKKKGYYKFYSEKDRAFIKVPFNGGEKLFLEQATNSSFENQFSLRLIAEDLGITLSKAHRLKEISVKEGFARYFPNWLKLTPHELEGFSYLFPKVCERAISISPFLKMVRMGDSIYSSIKVV